MSSIGRTAYDEVQYPGHPLAQAQPDRLATIATLFGMTPCAAPRCRVLELGCGDGTNLISTALAHPGAQCLGIDLAAAHIQKAKAVAAELGLTNVTFLQGDILDIGPDCGEFDYIVAHGVYSWVPPAVRDGLLKVCKRNLAPNGVAYVSYNAQPGGHFREMLREMMLFHVAEMPDAEQKVSQARALISFLIRSNETRNEESAPFRGVLQQEMDRIARYEAYSLFHDDLNEINTPMYFHRFASHAAEHGLQYLGEAQFYEMGATQFPPEVAQTIQEMADSLIAAEQYLDFVKCRRFRQTLLCHAEQPLNRKISIDCIEKFSLASPISVQRDEVNLQQPHRVTFQGPLGAAITTDHPLIQAALVRLGEAWPQTIPFRQLLDLAQQDCKRVDSRDAATLSSMMLRFYAGGGMEFHIHPPAFVTQVSERPVASPLARLQSRTTNVVTNLRHYSIAVEPGLPLALLRLLDGTRDRRALEEELWAQLQSGVIGIEQDGAKISDPTRLRALLAEGLDRNLKTVAELALLRA